AGVGRLPDGAGRALPVVLAVRGVVDAAEAVALDDALEALALRGARDADAVALGEHVAHGDLGAEGEAVEPGELDEVPLGPDAGGLEVAGHRLRGALGLLVAEGELDGRVAVAL